MEMIQRDTDAVAASGRAADRAFKRISVIGLGYIGLPTAAVFAARGIEVIGVDVNAYAVETINSGRIHIVEPDLDMVVHAATQEGRLRATLTPEPAEAFLIAVPTPFKGDHEPDLRHIEAAAKAIAPVLAPGNIVVLESTSPVGATEQLASWLADARPDLTFPQQAGEESDIRVAYCPERVLPGHVLRELVDNDRVIGGMTARCSAVAKRLYKTFVQGECVITNARTAEMCKLTENAFRDVNIAFANEMSLICDKLDINVWELIGLANRHPRVNILRPGPGVGGHCIAVDPWFIFNRTPEQARLVHTARLVNDGKPDWVIAKVVEAITAIHAQHQRTPRVAILGLAFKPNIDDLRESPAMEIAKQLGQRSDAEVCFVEPNITALPASAPPARLVSLEEALPWADIVVVLVGHDEFVGMTTASSQIVIDAVGLIQGA